MAISSTLFVFGILPIFLIVYYVSKPKIRIYELLLVSIWFYYLNDPQSLWIFALMTAVNYLISLLMTKTSGKIPKFLLILGILGNAALLILYKYTGFIGEIIGVSIPVRPEDLMLGISFSVFGFISYLVDVYQNRVAVPRNPVKFGAWTFMFPKVISGPIIRYADTASDFEPHALTAADIGFGAREFMEGFIKKVLIADNLHLLINELNNTTDVHSTATVATLWIGAIAYSLQLYFDFSGYSHMAIGLARLLGFHFKDNFNHPYACSGFSDFWRRWHISLSEWFRDYIFIPLGGSRSSTARNILNLLVVWLMTGIWHGAGYSFIVWGLVFFVMLLLEKYVVRPERLRKFSTILWRIFTLLIINFNWVIFRCSTLEEGFHYILGMFGACGNQLSHVSDIRLLREYGFFIVLGILMSFPVTEFIRKKAGKNSTGAKVANIAMPLVYGIAFLWALSFALLGYHNPYMYQQF